MKKLSLTFLFFFGIIGFTFSQGDFAPIGAEWHYSYADLGLVNAGYTLEKSIKDTVINGTPCRQIETMRYSRNTLIANAPVDTAGPFYKYYYSNPDTVFYYNTVFNTFLPLYIFNVNVGDTMVYHISYIDSQYPDSFFRLLVTNITDTTISGKTLRTIHNESLDEWGFDGGESQSYTELLGTQIGNPEHSFGYHPLSYIPPHIRCYIDDDILFRPDVNTACDSIPPAFSNIKGNFLKNYGITLYPNPTTDYFRVEKLNPTIDINTITIRDITGRAIKSLIATTANRYYIADLTNGMYIVEIITQEGSAYFKLNKN